MFTLHVKPPSASLTADSFLRHLAFLLHRSLLLPQMPLSATSCLLFPANDKGLRLCSTLGTEHHRGAFPCPFRNLSGIIQRHPNLCTVPKANGAEGQKADAIHRPFGRNLSLRNLRHRDKEHRQRLLGDQLSDPFQDRLQKFGKSGEPIPSVARFCPFSAIEVEADMPETGSL